MESTLGIKDFDFGLLKEPITRTPIESRNTSRPLILDRISNGIQHRHFYSIIDYLNPNNCLILNDSRVLPTRIYGIKEGAGARVEFLLLAAKGDDVQEILAGPDKCTRPGNHFSSGGGFMTAKVLEIVEDGSRLVKFSYQGSFYTVLDQIDQMPLPPYIKKKFEDKERYQTVYSHEVGPAAAPTVGLHLTKELLGKVREKGTKTRYVTLHVGLGTLRLVSVDKTANHKVHSEHYWLPQETADLTNKTKKGGGRVIPIDTTSYHTIKSVAEKEDCIKEGDGFTNTSIYPGFQFKILDDLITNFHLLESTLIMLVSALASREHILNAYRIAMQKKYRSFSFGDAMFVGSRTE